MKSSLLSSLAVAASVLSSTSAFSVQSQLTKAPSSTALSAATPIGPSGGWNPFGSTAEVPTFLQRKDVVVIDPDFKLAWMFFFASIFIFMVYPDRSAFDPAAPATLCLPTLWGGLGSFIHAWFGAFLLDRTNRCRVLFNDRERKFEIKNIYKEGSWSYGDKVDGFEERTNYVVGGPSGWKYDKFLNYGFVPSVDVPILVYFKEDGTPENKWNVGPGKYDPVGKGMVHFFPAFGNSYQIKREFEKRNLNKRRL
mmetsp:Transcript_31577/g.58190  ORF Transcript_31577/g.58190 Transcript_31577/m.58190 type:complete len:252 (-) Transcript_31577:182-937(-)|eukprot:CAMPEP_0197448700 /NCGR_PEP_ID=MMETSP1175-20131217/18574_1 /TAXON_ID=1003142 /ORGANISM="Triceratium dubium, Strain CCMP147" /LENGTH=251 /DNA_ID=CAMNT_0042980559 /DNA_START=191 /DNA_END=946 /DNA_ORIENTATION=+